MPMIGPKLSSRMTLHLVVTSLKHRRLEGVARAGARACRRAASVAPLLLRVGDLRLEHGDLRPRVSGPRYVASSVGSPRPKPFTFSTKAATNASWIASWT
jgi:hypothetical protein